jgi:very-short-patch-repair endonuclease/predicted transcriptional regulator of viral defense system
VALERPRPEALAALAARQHGVVATWQLRELGFSRGAIAHLVAAERLHRLYRGVYAVGHTALHPHGRLMAATLACGPDAVLSHRDAAAVWGLRPSARPATDVTVPGLSRHGQRGITIHRTRSLPQDERAVRDGLPVTTVARTLLDLAEVIDRHQVRRAFEEAERLRLFDLRALKELARRHHGRRGLAVVNELLAEAVEPPVTRSELERRFLELCHEAGLPAPQVNTQVAGFEVDMAWPEARLVVELDGHEFHRTRAAFERDRARDAALQVAGHRVLRVTNRRMARERTAVVHAVRTLIAASDSGHAVGEHFESHV